MSVVRFLAVFWQKASMESALVVWVVWYATPIEFLRMLLYINIYIIRKDLWKCFKYILLILHLLLIQYSSNVFWWYVLFMYTTRIPPDETPRMDWLVYIYIYTPRIIITRFKNHPLSYLSRHHAVRHHLKSRHNLRTARGVGLPLNASGSNACMFVVDPREPY